MKSVSYLLLCFTLVIDVAVKLILAIFSCIVTERIIQHSLDNFIRRSSFIYSQINLNVNLDL